MLLFNAQAIYSQNIVRIEYFVDTDPGFGNGSAVTFTAASVVDVSFVVDLSGVSNGFHILYVRAKDANEGWSLVHSELFFKETVSSAEPTPNIVKLEYFIDTDPGFGLGAYVAITPDPNITKNFMVDLSGVSNGFHILYVRAKDVNGGWSLVNTRPFFKETVASAEQAPLITSIKWFFEKRGVKSGVFSHTDFPDTNDVEASFTASFDSLILDSTYNMHLFAQDANGSRSLEFIHQVTVVLINSSPTVQRNLREMTYDEDFGTTIAALLDSVFNDLDLPDNDSLRFSAVVSNGIITQSFSGDTLFLHSVGDSSGVAQVIVTAIDDSAAAVSDTFMVTINRVNDPPSVTAIPDTSFFEDDTLTIDLDLYVSDVDDSLSRLDWDVRAVGGSLISSIISGRETIKSFLLPYSVNRSVDADKRTKRVSGISSLNKGDFGFIDSSPVVMDGDTVTVTIDSVTHIATFTSTLNYNIENIPFVFTATDTSGAFDSDTMRITVLPVNDPPVFVSSLPDTSFAEDGALSFPLTDWFQYVADVDDADLTLVWEVINGSNVSATVGNDSVRFSAPQDWFGKDTLRVVVRDLTLSDTTELIITVSPVNDPPVVEGIPLILLDEDTIFSFDLDSFVSDVDNDTSELSWTAELVQPGSNSSTGMDANLTLTPRVQSARGKTKTDNPNQGKLSVTKKAKITGYSFRENGSRKMAKGIADASVNRIGSKKSNSTVRKTVIYLLSEGGIAVDSIMISIDNVTHVATITPTANFFAFDIPVLFTATDPASLSDSDTTEITVSPVNDPPLLSNLPDVVLKEDEFAVVHFSDWFGFVDDLDNPDSTLVWSLESGAGDSVSFIIQGDSVIFEAPQDWFAFDRDTIQVIVNDGFLTDAIGLAVHVMPVNDPPMFVDFPDSIILEFGQGDTLILSDFVLDIDDPDSLLLWAQFDCVGLDSIVCVTTSADTAFIQPLGNFSGSTKFKFWVTDTSGASDTVSTIIYVMDPVGVKVDDVIPLEFSLSNNYPNPFNPQTRISYGLPQQSDITLTIYNLMGQKIMRWDEHGVQPGYYSKTWNGLNKFGVPVGSGVYLYRLVAGNFVQTKKMILLK